MTAQMIIEVALIVTVTCVVHSCSNTPPAPAESDVLSGARQEDPAFSHDGRLIAFVGEYDSIYAVHFVDIDGNYVGHIFQTRADSARHVFSSPSWNPTNDRIALSIDGNISVVKVDGDSLIQLTNTGEDFACSWSYDGENIAYTKTICDPTCGIVVLTIRNNSTKIVAQFGMDASWNSASRKIYFCHTVFLPKPDPMPSEYAGFVFERVDLDTGLKDSLFYVANSELWLNDCTVSPDESEILFSAAEGAPPRSNIWKLELSTGVVTQLTQKGGRSPSYSPDGFSIVYSNTNASEGGLWIMDRTGGNKRRLTRLAR